MATVPMIRHTVVKQGGAAAGGGAFVAVLTLNDILASLDAAQRKNRIVYFEAHAFLSSLAAGNIANGGKLTAKGTLSVKNAVLSFTPALLGGVANPATAAALLAVEPMTADAAFIGAGLPTLVPTVPGGANLTLTLANPGATAADVSIWVDFWIAGSA